MEGKTKWSLLLTPTLLGARERDGAPPDGVILRGKHTIKAYSKTQSTVCLSSAEAELGGIVTAASTSLGMQSIAKDLGFDWSIELRADASAAIGICRRRGLGKVRHLHTADLWVQDKLKAGDFALRKTPGVENIADMMTKYLPRADLERHTRSLDLHPEEGRATSAPRNAEDPAAKEETSQGQQDKEETPQERKPTLPKNDGPRETEGKPRDDQLSKIGQETQRPNRSRKSAQQEGGWGLSRKGGP